MGSFGDTTFPNVLVLSLLIFFLLFLLLGSL